MSDDLRRAREVLTDVYERLDGEPRINPAWLATEVCNALDDEAGMQRMRPELYRLAHEQVKQMARALCRRHEMADGTMQHPLFPDLQHRYPAARQRGDEPEYVLLEYMVAEDVAFNVDRLMREAGAKQAHAEALRAWWNDHHGVQGNVRVL